MMKPFIKWAGGKRWLVEHPQFALPTFTGRYIEPFVGGGAVFFHTQPQAAILGDANRRLISTYEAIAVQPEPIARLLRAHHAAHCKEHYYRERGKERKTEAGRAAQFLYLNRTCWNGLYRENLKGVFNVPIGTKSIVYDETEDFAAISATLRRATLMCQDFELTVNLAEAGDLLFVDPPYTTAHNTNGFVKYNQKIFSWQDQERLKEALVAAKGRGATVLVTNASHDSIAQLYHDADEIQTVKRRSVISGLSSGRRQTEELLIRL